VGRLLEIQTPLHAKTSRDYLARVTRGDKAECAEVASRFDADYWDGDRKYGYGGFRYDGRWKPVAAKLVEHYGLGPGSRVLDVGCGKAFLLFELQSLVPGLVVEGIDVSAYALEHAKEEVRPHLRLGRADELPYPDRSFDLVISLMTLHNLPIEGVVKALREVARVTRRDAYITTESYRNEQEKANLLAWQLTCRSFHDPDSWRWLFELAGYTGDYELMYFE
jgi:ubiquinone/menaquinone biosynthesis C-methylase UbiE